MVLSGVVCHFPAGSAAGNAAVAPPVTGGQPERRIPA